MSDDERPPRTPDSDDSCPLDYESPLRARLLRAIMTQDRGELRAIIKEGEKRRS